MGDEGDAQSGADPFYRDLCSAATLATAQRGFFAQLAELVTDADDADDALASFAASPSDKARVVAVYAMPQVRAALANVSPVFRGKDAVVSRRRRVAADRALADGELESAVALYSQAVVRAPATAATWAAPDEGDEVVGQGGGKEDGAKDGGGGKKGKENTRGRSEKHTEASEIRRKGTLAEGNKENKCIVGIAEQEAEGKENVCERENSDLLVDDESKQDAAPDKGTEEEAAKGKRRRRRRKKGPETSPAPLAAPTPAPAPATTPTPTPAPMPKPTPTQAAADDDSDERCLCDALSGRSAALAALGKHRLCVLDVRAALAQGCAPEQRALLCRLLAVSCHSLGMPELADDCARAQTHTDALRVANRAARAADGMESRKLPQTDLLAGGVHGQLHDASARLTLAETPASGRFVVAGEPLATGDTLVVQSPHAAVAFTEADATHCHHCLVRLEAAVACPRCSALAFCSERCLALAGVYHALECSFHDLLIGSGASALCRLALRIVTQRPLDFFLALRDRLADRADVDEVEPYLRVHALETHAARRGSDDFLQRTIMALFLLRILQRAGYFPEPSADDAGSLSCDEVLIGSLLLRHLQLLQFNAHEITETTPNVGKTAARYRSVGVGVYPTASLFNHDCHPALARHFVGSRMVLRLLRPVARGTVVGENYGPAFTRLPLAMRRRVLLSRYWFRCECGACRNDWPQMDKLGSNLFRFRCPSPGCAGVLTQPLPPPPAVRCASCSRSVSLADAAAALTTTLADVQRSLASASVEDVARCVDRLHSVCAPPLKDMQVAEDALRGLFAMHWVV